MTIKRRIEALEAQGPKAGSGCAFVVFDDEPAPPNPEGRAVIRVRFVSPMPEVAGHA